MIPGIGYFNPATRGRADLIYEAARSELTSRLWNAALGGAAEQAASGSKPLASGKDSLDSLLAVLLPNPAPTVAPVDGAASPADRMPPDPGEDGQGNRPGREGASIGLGPNRDYEATLLSGAQRTGVPASALAAIVHAEASTGPDGRWLAYSRNRHSSAAGLGQFLSGTWASEAERTGTWLHDYAAGHGWLSESGKIRGESRSDLLALRYDGHASIEAIADYAKLNLDRMRQAGVTLGDDAASIARSAYVGHHLGFADGIRFIRGELDQGRARHLLKAQIGKRAAEQRIAVFGNATIAHREWLFGYIARNVRTDRYANLRSTVNLG